MKAGATIIDRRVTRGLSILAGALSFAISVAIPTSFFLAERIHLLSHLEASAELATQTLSEYVSRNPDLWRFQSLRLNAVLRQLGERLQDELSTQQQILDADMQVVAQYGDPLSAPVLMAQASVFDAGVPVGTVTFATSLRPLLMTTGAIALAAGLLGIGTFTMLRLVPLRLLRQAMTRAAHLATHDALTGLPNRVLFRDRLDQALARLEREGGAIAVLCLDLDRFKEVNDTLGHAAGDLLLRQVSERVSTCLRQSDTLARLGGDEFAIIQIGARQPSDAEALAQRIIATLAAPFDLNGHLASIGVSIGIALRHHRSGLAGSAEGLVQDGDVALYRAKAEARGCYRFFEPDMNQRLLQRRALEADMRTALAAGHFHLHFQPQIELRTRGLVGAEALLRWNHPERGPISPADFIPLAEETGLIQQLGEWVLQQACREASAWSPDLSIGVNVSPVQFRRPGFVASVERALAETGLPPSRLELEITENVLLSDTQETLATLERLRDLGVGIAMDDFGTGYSSLGYLQRFAFDKIKIDRSFIARLSDMPQASAIVGAVLGMGRALSIRVIAEGVETQEQARVLTVGGCDEAQGYLFSRPVPAHEFRALATRAVVSQAA